MNHADVVLIDVSTEFGSLERFVVLSVSHVEFVYRRVKPPPRDDARMIRATFSAVVAGPVGEGLGRALTATL